MSETNGTVTRESIFAPANNERRFQSVKVQQWGGTVRAYAVSENDAEIFSRETARRFKKRKSDKNSFVRVRSRALIATICDEQGVKLFTDADEDRLSEQVVNLPKRLINAALDACGLTEDEADDLEGN